MKTLFTSLPEHLLTPAFKKQCKDILKGMNRFLRAAGVDPESIPNLAGFMRQQKLYAAYIEQAADSGWATFSLNGLVDDRHYAAVAGFLLDRGRLNDEFLALTESLNTIPMTEDLITGGIRGLHRHMGLVNTPEAVEITIAFAGTLFSLWKKKALVEFVQDEMEFSASAMAICTMQLLGLKPYPFIYGPDDITALTCTDHELYVARPTIDPSEDFEGSLQGPTHPLDQVQTALESMFHLITNTDIDQDGVISQIDKLTQVIAGFLEMPVLVALRNDVPGEFIWRDLKGRCDLLTTRLLDSEVKTYLSSALALGVIEAQQKLLGIALDDPLLINTQRRALKRQWKSLNPEQQRLGHAYATRIELKTGLMLPEFEARPECSRASLAHMLRLCADQNSAALTKAQGLWPEGIDRRLWPTLLDKQALIHKAGLPSLLSSVLVASIWSNRAVCRRTPGGRDRLLYGRDYAYHSADRVLSESKADDLEFQRRTFQALHHYGLLDETTIAQLGWSGAVLAELELDVTETVHAAMLENDLGL